MFDNIAIFVTNLPNIKNYSYTLEVVVRVSETQLQVCKNNLGVP